MKYKNQIIAVLLIIFVLVILFFPQGNANDTGTEDDDLTNIEAITKAEGNVTQEVVLDEYLEGTEGEDVVLFFHAIWCPTCNALARDLNNKLDEFPDNLRIVKLDYDDERSLKDKYGVRVQHTMVQVDSEGNEITKWIGGNTLDSILQNL